MSENRRKLCALYVLRRSVKKAYKRRYVKKCWKSGFVQRLAVVRWHTTDDGSKVSDVIRVLQWCTWAAQMLSRSCRVRAFSLMTKRRIFSSFSTYCGWWRLSLRTMDRMLFCWIHSWTQTTSWALPVAPHECRKCLTLTHALKPKLLSKYCPNYSMLFHSKTEV